MNLRRQTLSRVPALALLATLAVPLAIARAQEPSINKVAGFVALTHTPAGLFAPVWLDARPGAGVALRYGHAAVGPFANEKSALAATALLPIGDGTTSFSLTAGMYDERCPDPECSWKAMLGAGAAHRLLSTTMGAAATRTSLDVSVDGELGWSAEQFHTTYVTARVGLPVGLVVRTQNGLRFTPYIVPSLGWGHAHEDRGGTSDSFSSTRAMIGGGLELGNASGRMRATVGFMHTSFDDARTTFGAGISIRP